MAHRFDVTKLLTGPKSWIFHLYIKSDGVTSDIDSKVLFDPVVENLGEGARFSLEDVTSSLDGFSIRLHFELLTEDNLIWVLTQDSHYVDFKKYGGLKDRGHPVDNPSGKLFITTRGLQPAGNEGSLIIKVKRG